MVKHSRDTAIIAGLVYFAQGALGIAGISQLLFLRNLHWSVTEITTISSAAALPWILKILVGLLSDSFPLFGYRRKSYLILYSILSALGWFFLAVCPPEKIFIFASLFLANVGFAATDVITDGLIVEHSTEFSSHIYQSIAWGSRSFGAIVSGVLGGWLAAHWYPRHVFILTMLLPLSVTAFVILIRDKKIESSPFATALMPVKRCMQLVVRSNVRWFAAILIVISISATFGTPFFFFMKEKLGFTETFLGFLMSLGWAGALLGSVIYGKWLRRISCNVTLRWAIILNSINILSTLFILDRHSAFVFVFVGGIMLNLTILPMMSSAAMLTHHTGVEGTLFAILMSIYNFGQIFFGYLGGRLFEKIGLYPLIIVTGVIALSGIIFVNKLNPLESRHPPA